MKNLTLSDQPAPATALDVTELPVSTDTVSVDLITYEDVPTILGAPLSEIKVEDRAHALRGAQILAQCLTLEGVEVLFGYPGGANLEIFDVLQEYGIRCIRVEHEQGAAHAAEGFARATGKVGEFIKHGTIFILMLTGLNSTRTNRSRCRSAPTCVRHCNSWLMLRNGVSTQTGCDTLPT